ncbi:hypothetical protein NIES4101_28130 (plasmid) [Calothrix sp. NIES-4101]|nr:hypothetical protein NIES4101_28130 [Calothrix sp. NIES-4101]
MSEFIEWVVEEVRYLEEYKLLIKFRDGKLKIIDFKDELWGEVFEPLKDINNFKKVSVKYSSIEWENGADIAPEWLYENGVEVTEMGEPPTVTGTSD